MPDPDPTGFLHRQAKAFASLRREGKNISAIGRMFSMSRGTVALALERGCPPFRVPLDPPKRVKQARGERPDWSYPDEELLALCRVVRAEIEAADREAATRRRFAR